MVPFAVDAILMLRAVFVDVRQRLAVSTRFFWVIGHDSEPV